MPSAVRPVLTTLSNCDREPIHAPEAIQPHGFLLVVETIHWTVVGASANARDYLWRDAQTLWGTTLAGILGDSFVTKLSSALTANRLIGRAILIDEATLTMGTETKTYSIVAHRTGDLVIVEAEVAGLPQPVRLEQCIQSFLTRLAQTESVRELQQVAVREIREITGFDRCLLYQFDSDWNGNVVAEDRNEVLPTYLNQRFPASDIPRPARELYRKNRVRMIPSNQFRPSSILIRPGTPGGENLDLSHSVLRSVSPIHLEYMRNMGTGSSMSIAVQKNDELWGLISCHSRESRTVPFEVRSACDLLGQIFSSNLVSRQQSADASLRNEMASILIRLLQNATGGSSTGVKWSEDDMLALGRASGVAIVDHDHCRLIGETPGAAEAQQLSAILAKRSDSVTFWTQIPDDVPPALRAKLPAGVLAARLDCSTMVLWFRPEVIEVVDWGGEPRKAIEADGEGRTLHPRKSFEVWRETVSGHSLPWEPSVIATVRDFQRAVSAMLNPSE